MALSRSNQSMNKNRPREKAPKLVRGQKLPQKRNEKDTHELRGKQIEALSISVNRSSDQLNLLWVTFIVFMLYLALSYGTITHKTLFLETPIKMPLLNVDLPLVGFFVISPLLLFLFHIYILTKISLLAGSAIKLDELISKMRSSEASSPNYRLRLEHSPFLQLIAGFDHERKLSHSEVILQTIVYSTIIISPIAILIMCQERFIPYHSIYANWWHRIVIILDLSMLWVMWPRWAFNRRGAGRNSTLKYISPVVLTIYVVFLTIVLASWQNEYVGSKFGIKDNRNGIFGTGIYTNVLFLPAEDFVDDDALRRLNSQEVVPGSVLDRWPTPPNLDLRGRDLSGATLSSADLRQANFQAAVLSRVNFSGALLARAQFAFSTINDAKFTGANIAEARLNLTTIIGTDFTGAKVDGASFHSSFIKDAKFIAAEMTGSYISATIIVGSNFYLANLTGAIITSSVVISSQFNEAKVAASSIHGVEVIATSFLKTHFDAAELIGVRFYRSNFGGATFNNPFMSRILVRRSAPITQGILNAARQTSTYLDPSRTDADLHNSTDSLRRFDGSVQILNAARNIFWALLFSEIPQVNTHPFEDNEPVRVLSAEYVRLIESLAAHGDVGNPDHVFGWSLAEAHENSLPLDKFAREKALAVARAICRSTDAAPFALRLLTPSSDAEPEFGSGPSGRAEFNALVFGHARIALHDDKRRTAECLGIRAYTDAEWQLLVLTAERGLHPLDRRIESQEGRDIALPMWR